MTQSNLPPSLPRAARNRQRAGAWLFAAVVLGSALALGGLVTWILCVITGALAASTFLLWFGAEGTRGRPVAGVLVTVAVVLLVFTGIQCIPMPIGWLKAIAPESADVWSRALNPLHEPGPSSATLSLDPIATRIQVLRGVAYLLAFVSALRIAQRREGVTFLIRVLSLSGLVLAFAALLHPALGAEKVFWIYEPENRAIAARHIAPLLNANHLGAYLNVGICVTLAAAISPKPPFSRSIAFGVFLVLLATELWVASRGGVIGTVLGCLVVVVMTRAARRVEYSARMNALALGAVFIAGIGMIVLSSSEEAWQELATSDVSKLELSREALRLARLFPVFGVGRGAFQVAYPAVREIPGYIDFTHPENIVAQWATEWGIPVALLAAAAIAWALRPSTVMARSQPPVGAWGAIAALGVHNLVDFSLEVPAVVIAAAVCAAVAAGGTGGGGARGPLSGWSLRTTPIAVSAIGAAVIGIAVVVPGMGHELRDDRAAMHERAVDVHLGAPEFRAAVRGCMLRHPGEAYFPFLGALRAFRTKEESVVPWIGRTLERSPVYGPAHLVLAQSLAVRSPSQARLEYRLALEQDSSTREAFRAEAPRLVGSYDDAMQLVPHSGPARGTAIYVLIESLKERLPATRVRLDDDLLAIIPDAVDPARRIAREVLSDLRDEEAAPWCAADRKACLAKGLAAAVRLKEAKPDECEGYYVHSQLIAAAGDPKRGLEELEDASAKVQDWTWCLRELVSIAREMKDEARVNAALERFTRAGCASDDECVQNLVYVARVEHERGNVRRALALYKKAYERNPTDDLLAASASLASHIGLHAEAMEDYAKLAEKNPGDSRWTAALLAEREAIARNVTVP
jgi:tetratricopeptide (TPR) repeat protein